MLSKISETKTNTVLSHFHVESKEKQKTKQQATLINRENRLVVARGGG